ncbi:glycosyltransferase WbsX family protein [Geomonas edaphica]|uniref:glycosyltransferase WbsX family protein n=1 Tax=Geomonas edaphica TaxID=2570226 RepID=UPI0010A880B2|nr:glycoside hydrolase family 99-like domain-containing protein [Geomonas edaphica]
MKAIAFHLPQFHPIPENNEWWGAGFTEWRNVAKARPLFPGHRQPNLPGDLGFYDLRLTETQIDQANLAALAGLSGFCYYHYWYAGRLLLEKPLELLLARKTPKFPFCLCWANHDWTAHWSGRHDMLVKQTYPGKEDYRAHYEYLRKFFEDGRYIRVNQKPVFAIFKPNDIPQVNSFVDYFKTWALEDGFGGIHLIALDGDLRLLGSGFDALAPHSLNIALEGYLKHKRNRLKNMVRHRLFRYPRWVIEYSELAPFFQNSLCDGITTIPTAIPNWDNTPRIGRRGVVLSSSSPEKFAEHLGTSITGFINNNTESEHILLIKSWNEWAEGNYLEPDLMYGKAWLETLNDFIDKTNGSGANNG